jgi:hypothetical protein
MSLNKQSSAIARFVLQTHEDAFFVGHSLHTFAQARNYSDAQLAAFLGCNIDSLSRAAMCRCPSYSDDSYDDHVRRIATLAGCDSSRLDQVLREAHGIAALRGIGTHFDNATLLAARDRECETKDGAQREEDKQDRE